MIKELFLAIVIGAVLGLGVTGGYLTLNKKNQTPKEENTLITEPTLVPTSASDYNAPTITPKKTDSIEINSPEDNSLLSSDKVNISGLTIPNSNLVIVTASNTFVGQSDDSGKFDISIKLDSGLNIIKVSSIESNGNQKDTQINLTYSTAKI